MKCYKCGKEACLSVSEGDAGCGDTKGTVYLCSKCYKTSYSFRDYVEKEHDAD